MIIREADSEDWEKLLKFFSKIYRKDHPLHTREFWEWQYGNRQYGRSIIATQPNGEIVGHIGANFQGEIAWIINAYLNTEYRGKGILKTMFAVIRNYYPLAATSTNTDSLRLFTNMGWIRHNNLIRFVKINPNIENSEFEHVCRPVTVIVNDLISTDTHYFRQPSLRGLLFPDGSQAVSQENVGGLRMVSFENIQSVEEEAWRRGFLWLDYLTSDNDQKIQILTSREWKLDYRTTVPWHLNPVEQGKFANLTFMSEGKLSPDFVISRVYADHGRIGSLK